MSIFLISNLHTDARHRTTPKKDYELDMIQPRPQANSTMMPTKEQLKSSSRMDVIKILGEPKARSSICPPTLTIGAVSSVEENTVISARFSKVTMSRPKDSVTPLVRDVISPKGNHTSFLYLFLSLFVSFERAEAVRFRSVILIFQVHSKLSRDKKHRV